MATTQFEATDARAAFPCFDEPEFKSQFIVTLVHEKGYKALSNMPVEKVITRNDGFMESHFEETVKMSTYLLAFIVSDFAYKETHTKAGKKVLKPVCLYLCLLILKNSNFPVSQVPLFSFDLDHCTSRRADVRRRSACMRTHYVCNYV